MALNQGNYYILVTESTVKLTYVRTVPEPGMIAAERDPEKGKRADNVRRAKTMFLDIDKVILGIIWVLLQVLVLILHLIFEQFRSGLITGIQIIMLRFAI